MTEPHANGDYAVRFCPRCDVVLSLHYGEDDCDGAGLRADVLSAGDRLMGHVPSPRNGSRPTKGVARDV